MQSSFDFSPVLIYNFLCIYIWNFSFKTIREFRLKEVDIGKRDSLKDPHEIIKSDTSDKNVVPFIFFSRMKSASTLLLLALVGILIYSRTFAVPFQFDDLSSIVDNDKLRALFNFWPPSGTRYIGYLSFALNYHFGELDVFGYHLVNLVIHIINGFFVWWLVILTFETPIMYASGITVQQKGLIALLSALIFIAHPVQTEAVTYIVQRFTSLATLFYLLSLIMYIKARLLIPASTLNSMSEQGNINIKAWFYYVTSVMCTILAMKTKEISFTLPFVIVLYEVIFFTATGSQSKEPFLKRIYMLVPFLITLLVIPLSLIGTAEKIGDIIGEIREATQETEEISRFAYLLTEFSVLVAYIRLLFLPINQNLDYDYPINHSLNAPVMLSLLFLLLIFGLAVYLFHISRIRHRRLSLIAFGIFWFFITLSVESTLIPIRDVITEHRLYLPSVGMIIAFTSTVFFLLNNMMAKQSFLWIGYSLLFMLVLPLCIAAYSRNLVWGSEVTLWKDVVMGSPNKPRGYYNLGLAYQKQGRREEAVQEYMTAMKLNPNFPGSHHNLGLIYYEQGRLEEAAREYMTAIKLIPEFPWSYNNLGLVYYRQGRLEEAIQEYTTAIKLKPEYPEAHHHLGLAYYQQGRLEQAIREYMTAIKLKPGFPGAHNSLGLAYHQQGKLGEAIQEYLTTIRLRPEFLGAHYRLGLAYYQQGRLEEAIQEYMVAIKLKPEFPEAHNNLGLTYYQQGKVEAAIQEYTTALKLKPAYPEAHYNLGNAYKMMGFRDEARKHFESVLKLRPDFSPAQDALKDLEITHKNVTKLKSQ